MKKNFWRLALVMLIALLLAGCGAGAAADDLGAALLRAPELSEQQIQLQKTVTEYLGESIVLKYPMNTESSTPYFWWDADGDGTQELIVLYQNTAKSKNVQLAVMKQNDRGWYAAHMDVEGVGGDVDGVRSIRLADGHEYLLAGYQDSTGQDWTVCLYRWQNGALQECARLLCQQYTTVSLEGDAAEQLVMVQYSEMYGNLQLRVYGAPKTPDSAEVLEEWSSTILDSRFARCLFLQPSIPEKGALTLVMDFMDASGNSLGEVMTYQNGRFVRCYTEDGSNIPNFTARPFQGLLPSDQNGDGSLELPRVETQVFGGTFVRFYFISWYQISGGETLLREYCLADMQEGYLLTLPESWHGKVMLQADGGGVWSLRYIENGIRRAWFCLADEQPDSGYQSIGDLGSQRMYIQFPEQTAMEDRFVIINGLQPLYW